MSRPTIPSKRPAADAQEAAWIADEDRFVLQQAKKKAAIRIKGGRAQPIDWLAVTLAVIDPDRNPGVQDELVEDGEDLEIVDPESVIEGLNGSELADLERGIDSYLGLESSRKNLKYWKMMKTIAKDRQEQQSSNSAPAARGVTSVASDLDKLLGPKSLDELERLETQIKAKLASNEPIDTDYWEHLLKSLLTYKAKANLRKVSRSIVEARLEGLRKQQAAEAEAWKARLDASLPDEMAGGEGANTEDGRDSERHALDPEPLLRMHPEDKSLESMDANGFVLKVKDHRRRVIKRGYIPTWKHSGELSRTNGAEPSSKRQRTDGEEAATQSTFDREVARGLGDNEEIFSAEEPVATKNLSTWSSQYPPRKPRYFNRVITGYEWNKYNQTHYDHDNPPPKVVQGYKFNVFYPDLVDNTRAPTYRIEREAGRRRGEVRAKAGEDDTCLIRFMAGPPYEDIAFRIVDREWDFSAKRERGFRSSFDKGILMLHLQFKKIYYRK